MGYDVWSMNDVVRLLVEGIRGMVYGERCMVYDVWSMDEAEWHTRCGGVMV